MASFIFKKFDGTFTNTRTVTDTTADFRTASSLRVAVDASGNARLTAYTSHTPKSLSQTSAAPDQFIGACHVYSCATADSTFTKLGYIVGVKEGSQPFFNSNTGRWYVNLLGYRGGTSIAGNSASATATGTASLLVDITAAQAQSGFAPPQRFRIAASVGEYAPDASSLVASDVASYAKNNITPAYRPAQSGVVALMGQGQIGIIGTRNYSMYALSAYDPSHTTFAIDAFSGGIVGSYDGYSPAETGFAVGPQVYAIDQGSGTLAAGTYNYVAIWTYKDKAGRSHFSRCSEPVSIVTAGGTGKIAIDVSAPGVSSTTGQISVQLYRTISGGTQYFRLATTTATTVSGSGPMTESFVTFTDQTSDATLQSSPLLYRQPGTTGTALDRVSALSGKHVVRHKDRVFYAHENTVYFSSFDVDGEAPWFSPGLSFDVVNGEGPIVGLASMDGILVVFKRNDVYLVDGDGPPENGGSGNEFSPPRKLNVVLGCIDPRSICAVPDGIIYRSQRGIELLDRGLKSSWIGQQVARTVNANPYTGGCTYNHSTGRLYMALASSVGADGGFTFNAVPGVVVVYDTVTTSWVKFSYTNSSNIAGFAMQDICYANATVGTTDDNLFLVDHSNTMFCESATSGLDNGNFTSWSLATGWVRAQSKQDRIKVTDIFFLGNRYSNHNLFCQAFYDWNKLSQTSIRTFDATATNKTPEQMVFQPPRETCQAVKFALFSNTPSNPTTLGSGQVGEINGITIRVGLKGGGVKLPLAQKG